MKKTLYLCTLLLLSVWFTGTVFGQVASFTASPTAGCSPLVVNFTNTSTGATTYSWNLGNGVTTPDVDASTSYTAPGTYTVVLTATTGSSTSTHTMIITVYPSPTVSFNAVDTAVCPGTPVDFNSTTTGGVPGPVTYIWNYGDGTSGTGATPSHVFPGPGYYNITLSATNSEGCISSLTMAAYIHVYTPSNPNFTISDIYICNPPGSVTFTNTTTGFGPFSSTWHFGDGSPSDTGSPASHTYTAPGTYNVTLVETDGHGCTDSITIRPSVVVATITAAFTGPITACMYSSVTFLNTSSGYTASNWNFGNGSTSTSTSGTTAYSTAGTYTITLIVNNGGCADTITHTITILPATVASFSVSPAESCPPPTLATFTAFTPTGATVNWLFGDGAAGTGTPATHTFAACGAYTVSMIVTSTSGCVDTIKQIYSIYNMTVSINNNIPVGGCVPLSATFTCIVTSTCPTDSIYPYPIASYVWNYGDGSPTVTGGATMSHTYTAVGLYTCTVNIVTANGCNGTASLPVSVGTPPVPSFTAVPIPVCYGQPVQFVNTTTGATNYIWFFGDGGTDTLRSPSYVYDSPGVWTVTLIAIDNGCSDTLIMPRLVTVDSPMAIINLHFLCIPANEVLFIDTSIGETSREWFFGDGTTAFAKDTIHFYPTLGIYSVSLVTYNSRSGCHDTTSQMVDLIHPTVTFTANDTTICKYEAVTFTASVTDTGVISYTWLDNGTAFYASTFTNIASHIFTVTGRHTIMLIIIDAHGCQDTSIRTNYILVAKPAVVFSATPTTGCVILPVSFTDHSTDVSGVTFSNYAWSYGDGWSSSGSSPTATHSYSTAGTFIITEIVTDIYGCKDTGSTTVTADQPFASFYAAPTYACVGSLITFTNTSPSAVTSYWLFGDGSSASSASSTHVYSATGVYTVKLGITDALGCPDTAKYLNYIHITAPTAKFTESDSFSICVPLNEVFTNTSIGAVTYYWTFGDGSSSAGFSPSDLYIDTGKYTVTLIATNGYGCKDTITHSVYIYGYAGGFSYTPDSGCAPLVVNFSSIVSNVSSLIWDFGDGTTSSSHSTADTTHTYRFPGAYIPKLILSDLTGCQNSSIGVDTIKVDEVVASFTNTPGCINETINFLNGSTSYWSTITGNMWTFSATDTSTLLNPAYVYTTFGTYMVTLQTKDAWGCTATDVQNITITGLPTITVSNDTTICISDAATLVGYGGVSYTWSADVNLSCTACNPTHASPTATTTYTVTGKDAMGCTNTDTVTVFLRIKTNSAAFGDTAVCNGTLVPLWDTGATKFTWLPMAGLSDANTSTVVATPNQTTTYTVIARYGDCIPDTNYVTVIIYPLPTVDAGPNQTVVAGQSVQLQATGTNIYTYNWEPSMSLSCGNCANPVASMSTTTTYTVSVATIHNCYAEDTVLIDVYCKNSQIFVPNTFSPNHDGQDDIFYPRGTGLENIKSFRIYNRWGELLFSRENFQANDETAGWDGTFGGAPPRPDVYVFTLYATCENGQPLFIKGDVTIVK